MMKYVLEVVFWDPRRANASLAYNSSPENTSSSVWSLDSLSDSTGSLCDSTTHSSLRPRFGLFG